MKRNIFIKVLSVKDLSNKKSKGQQPFNFLSEFELFGLLVFYITGTSIGSTSIT